jgi:acyl carrier protein
LDGFARWQRGRGIPAWSINWGTWAQVGGASGVRLPGLDPIGPDEGTAALAALLSRTPENVGVLHFDAEAALAAFPEARRLPYFHAIASGTPVEDEVWEHAGRLHSLPPEQALRLIGERIATRIAAVLGVDRKPPRYQPLTDVGLDSLAAVRVKSLVEADFGVSMPTSVLVRGVTLADLETALGGQMGVSATSRAIIGGRDAAEREAVRLFEAVLGKEGVSVTDRLDALGGGEAHARRLVDAVVEQTGTELTVPDLLANPTPEWLATSLREAEVAIVHSGGTVRPLNPGAVDTLPLFLAHPAGGSTHVHQRWSGCSARTSRCTAWLTRRDGRATRGPVPRTGA